MNDAFRQLGLEVVLQVLELLVEGADDLLEVVRQAATHAGVDLGDAVEAEAAVGTLLVGLGDEVQVGQDSTDILELGGAQILGVDTVPVDVPVHGKLLAVPIATVAAPAVGERYRARKPVLAEEQEKVDLALDLVDLYDEFAADRFQEVVGVYRSLSNSADAQYFWQHIVRRQRVGVLLRNVGVCSHFE